MKSVITLCICTLFMVLCSSECYATSLSGFVNSEDSSLYTPSTTNFLTAVTRVEAKEYLSEIAKSFASAYASQQVVSEAGTDIKVATFFSYSDASTGISINFYPDASTNSSTFTTNLSAEFLKSTIDSQYKGDPDRYKGYISGDEFDSSIECETTVGKLVLTVGGTDTFTFYLVNPYYTYYYDDEEGEKQTSDATDKGPRNIFGELAEVDGYTVKSTTLNTLGYSADALYSMLEYIECSAKMGIIAGSLEYSFNVGSSYSNSLISIEDATEITKNEAGVEMGYVFKNSSSIIQVAEYMMSPLVGRLELVDIAALPTDSTDMTWEEFYSASNPWYVLFSQYIIGEGMENEGSNIFECTTVIPLNPDYSTFVYGLSEDGINSAGIGIMLNSNFDNTIDSDYFDAFNIPAEDPQGAVSYNLKMAYPYAFIYNGSSYKLDTYNFNIDTSYIYCVYDNNIYTNDADRTLVGSMTSDLRTSRDEIYLYRELGVSDSGETALDSIYYLPIVLICEYDEVVLDTSVDDDRFYGTGRRIGFKGSFTDRVYLTSEDSTLLYTDSDGGVTGFKLQNVSFLFDSDTAADLVSNKTVSGDGLYYGNQELIVVDGRDTVSVLASVSNGSAHVAVGSSPEVVKLCILFNQFDAIVDDDEPALKMENQYGFMLIRNNNYIDDSTLIDWLNSSVSFETFVEPEKLLDLIQGDFLSDLEKISYEEWLYIQDIKADLASDRERLIVDVMNMLSIILGTLLIIFAVLICLAYWIDIFNAFTDWSILEVISLGRLYPIEEDSVGEYLKGSKTDVKFVKFKDILLIALIFVLLGGFLYNVSAVISVIVRIYYYIIYVMEVFI